jgi:hypothetical protein
MSFPALTPSSRQFGSGNFPVSTYSAADGAEVRILRGNLRTGATLQLVYNALTDNEADLFINHYEAQKGSFLSFSMSTGALKGYEGNTASIDAGPNNTWRYASPVTIQSVYPGVSNVTVNLVGVL